MWQRFTEEARRAVYLAQTEAETFGETVIDTEHLLFGAMAQRECDAGAMLRGLGVDAQALRDEVLRLRGPIEPSKGPFHLSERGKNAIDLAYHASREIGRGSIGTGPLLLGLAREPEGVAGRALRALGANPETLARFAAEHPAQEQRVGLWSRMLRTFARKRPAP